MKEQLIQLAQELEAAASALPEFALRDVAESVAERLLEIVND